MENQPSLFSRLRAGLFKSRQNLNDKMDGLVAEHQQVSEDFFDDLMDILVLSDMGADCAARAIDTLRAQVKDRRIKEAAQAKGLLKEILVGMLDMEKPSLHWPMVILMVGVNGVGKTTTIGKLAMKFKNEGKKVLLAAGDTFRAAAAEQLNVWAQRAGADIVRHQEGADPASVIYDGIAAAKARGADIIICDTAGRLHNKSNLMNELNKISRVIDRELPGADRETLLVIDAATGQNGLVQARQFKDAAGITGLVLTKLDGTAKGGIVLAIADRLQIPVKLVGVGEKPEDLLEFDGRAFVEALIR